MKRFLGLIAAGVITLSATTSFAQNRDFAAHRLWIDDNVGNRLLIQYEGGAPGVFTFPTGNSFTLPEGTVTGQTTAWDDALGEWVVLSNLLNNGSLITLTSPMTTGQQITSTVAGGTAPFVVGSTTLVTNLNADLLDGLHASAFTPITRVIATNAPLTGGGDLSADRTLGLANNATLAVSAGQLGINLSNGNTWVGNQLLPANATQGANLITAINTAASTINAARIGNGLTNTQVNDDLTISGGSVNNSPVGNSSPSTGAFTTLSANSTVTFSALAAGQPVRTNGSSQLTTGAINLGTADVTGTLPAAMVGNGLTNTQVNDDLTINGGSINNSPITNSAISGSTGSFTTLQTSSTVTLGGIGSGPVRATADVLSTGAINLGTADVTGTLPAAMVGNGLTNTQVNDDLTINGGTISNSPISGSTGSFTTLQTSSTVTLGGVGSGPLRATANVVSTGAINLGTGDVTGTLPATSVGNGLTDAQVNDDLTISGGAIDNTVIGGSSPAAGTFTTIVGNGSGLTNLDADDINAGSLDAAYGGTGLAAAPANGVVLYGNGTGTMSTLSPGVDGQALILSGGVPTWDDVDVNTFTDHLVSVQSGTTTVLANANASGAGVGATESLAAGSTDVAGRFTVNTTNTSNAAEAAYVTVTFATPYTSAPFVVITPASADAGDLGGDYYIVVTTTGFTLHKSSNGAFNSKTITFNYHVIGGN
jgi:hypothetical protein